MKYLLRVTAAATFVTLLATNVPAMDARTIGPVSKIALAKTPSTTVDGAGSLWELSPTAALSGTCTAVSKEASEAQADCYALTAALAIAETNLTNAQNNLAVWISAYNACLAQPGWDCSFWEAQIAIGYDEMVAAEYALENAMWAWVEGGCEGWPIETEEEL